MIRLFTSAFKNQWSAQMKKPLEFFIGLLALILNNSFYLYGIYLLAILSNTDNPLAAKEYLISTGIVLTGWGLLNMFSGGLYELGNYIETGELETYLAKPKTPLLLVAISKSNLSSLGEVFQGLATIILSSILYDSSVFFKMLFCSIVLVFAFAALVIMIGSISFFSSRGSQISYVILQVVLSLSLFPVGRALKGREKWILYFSPLLITATLPRLIILEGGVVIPLLMIGATIIFFTSAAVFFNFGLKFYKSKNYIFINN
jgi:ABC-type uncharacterized transport system permease subunit